MSSRIILDANRCRMGEGILAKLKAWYARGGTSDPRIAAGMAKAAIQYPKEDPFMDAYGLSAGCGVPVDTIIQAAPGPEIAQTLLGKTSGLAVGAAPNQCTVFVAWGAAIREVSS